MKTGSTSIQYFLYQNRGLLRKQGYLYPLSVMQKNLQDCYDHNLLARRKLHDLKWRLQFEIKRNKCPKLLLSAEMLAGTFCTPESIAVFKAFLEELGVTKTHIILYIREPGALFASLCSQQIRDGAVHNYALCWPQDNPEVLQAASYQTIIENWGQVFGGESLRVRLFEREALHQGDLLCDFIQAVDCSWDEHFVIPPRQNETLNLMEMELLRRINAQLPGVVDYAGSPKYQIFQSMRRHLACNNDPQLKFAPPRQIYLAYRETLHESSAWVHAAYFADRPQLFANPELSSWRNNYELREMRPEYWDALAALIVELGTRGEHPLRVLLRKVRVKYRTRIAHWLRIIISG